MDDLDGWPTGRLLSMAARLVEQSWEHILGEYDLSSAGLVVLHVVASGPATQREIARACRVTDQTASRTVERLERLGYVSRQVDPRDERRRTVTSTPMGRRVYATLVEREKKDPGLLAAIGDDGAELRRMLLKLVRSRRTADDGSAPSP
ncbi:MarR family winged helix-turn-helix transcriptional regulator [Mycolicibacterium sp. 22603]|uniref:MarR family winged helix-turn-helix transcriptional regulator n=1 Tax=Mycolicibacterium sp. 22603 TaxID=3453950 RepID=UPI003F84C4C2